MVTKKSFHHLILLLLLITLGAGCGGPSQQPLESTQVVIPKVQAVPSGNPPEKRIISTETISQNNCGGSTDVSNTIERSRSIVYTVEVGAEISVNASGSAGVPGVGQVQVGNEVAAQYGVTYGKEETISRSLTVAAKEGTNMLHTFQQVEYRETGELIIMAGEKTLSYSYSFRKDFGIEFVKSENVGCPTSTISPTPTPAIPTTTSIPPTATPIPPTATPTLSPTPIYDTFDDGCINGDLWHMFVDNQPTLTFLPTPVSQCWELAERGFTEHNGYLDLDHTNIATDEVRSFYLVEQPGRPFRAVELDLTVRSMSGQWGGVGLFTRLNDADRTWAYYWLRFGGDLHVDQGRVVYEAGGERAEGEPILSLPASVTLEFRWDGRKMYFYADGNPMLQPVPFSDFSDTFGIYWVTGPNSSLTCHVDELRVSWE